MGVGIEPDAEFDAELEDEVELELEDVLEVELDDESEDGSTGSVGFSIKPGSESVDELEVESVGLTLLLELEDDELGLQYVNELDDELDDELDELDVERGIQTT